MLMLVAEGWLLLLHWLLPVVRMSAANDRYPLHLVLRNNVNWFLFHSYSSADKSHGFGNNRNPLLNHLLSLLHLLGKLEFPIIPDSLVQGHGCKGVLNGTVRLAHDLNLRSQLFPYQIPQFSWTMRNSGVF